MRIVRSIFWNYLGYFCELLAGFLLVAYVVRRVSVEDYGVLMLAQSVASFLFIVDLGLSSVLIQIYVSIFHSKGMDEVSRLASDLVLALAAVGSVAFAVLSLLAPFLLKILHVPGPEQATAVRLLMLVGGAVLMSLIAMPIDHLYQAFHRFDRINQIQVLSVVLRIVMTVWLLQKGYGVVGLALVGFVVTFVRFAAVWSAASSTVRGVVFRFRSFKWTRVREAVKSSLWAFGDDVLRRIGLSSESMILAAFGSMRQVAYFGMGMKLPTHVFTFAARGLSVMLPDLAQSHSEGALERTAQTYTSAFRVCVTGLMPIVIYAAICSRSLITFWAGLPYADAAPVLSWLLIAVVSEVLKFPSDLVLYSHGRIKQAARFTFVETIAKILLSFALVVPFGAAGVAAGVAICRWGVNVFFYLPEACRASNISKTRLIVSTLKQSWLQVAAFLLGVVVVLLCSHRMSPALMVAVFAATTAAYMMVWAWLTALPMWRAGRQQIQLLVKPS